MAVKQNTFFLAIIALLVSRVNSLPTNGTQNVVPENKNSRLCGMRHFSLPTISNPEFPWLIRLSHQGLNNEESVLCSGAAVSQYVAVVAAHCVLGFEKERLTVAQLPLTSDRRTATKYFDVTSVVVHHEFNATSNPGVADIALIAIRTENEGFDDRFACLPDKSDDPVNDCFEVSYPIGNGTKSQNNLKPVATAPLTFGPSLACLENPALRGYGQDADSILCLNEELKRPCFVGGSPVFCASVMSKSQFDFVGMTFAKLDWCSIGAYTRTARYVDWIIDGIEYFEGRPLAGRGETPKEEKKAETVDSTPCASEPCGENAVCWNSGSRYMCTCDAEYPEGNPYYGCSKCVYDAHCNPGKAEGPSKCINKTCVAPAAPKAEIPSEYVKTRNGDLYYLSQEELPWAQAQYECLSRKGYLAELNEGSSPDESFLSLLRSANKTGRFWVGASDFEERGKFKWYYSGKSVSESNWFENGGRPKAPATKEDDDRCLQVSIDVGGKWAVHSCELKSRFVCAHVSTTNDETFFGPLTGNNAASSTGGRANRQRNFDTLSPNAHYTNTCGRRFVKQREARIVGGGIAAYGEWPWQVSLRQYKSGQYRHKCGAALLTHEWIVTAAHCVKDVAPSNLLVRIGEYNILDTSEAHEHINRRITRIITHVNFDKASYEYDIALLRVDEIIPFQPNIIPICLPDTDSDLVGEEGWVTGWGRKSEYGQISPVLREVNLPIISNAKCMAMYRMSGQNEWIPRIFMCAGTANGGQDSCEGDSGGPLVIKGGSGRFQLAGIISWGIGCGDRNRPGVYTRISEFRTWIKKNTNYEDRNR